MVFKICEFGGLSEAIRVEGSSLRLHFNGGCSLAKEVVIAVQLELSWLVHPIV